jgi:hypothetical protein
MPLPVRTPFTKWRSAISARSSRRSSTAARNTCPTRIEIAARAPTPAEMAAAMGVRAVETSVHAVVHRSGW